MKNLLQANGIQVINNQIAKADVEKAVEVIAINIAEKAEKYKDAIYNLPLKKLKEIASDQEVKDDVDFSSQEVAANDVWELVFESDYKDFKKEFIKLAEDYGVKIK